MAVAGDSDGGRTAERGAGLQPGAGGGRARHRRRDRRLPPTPGTNPAAGAVGEDRGQRLDAGNRRIGRPRRANRPDRGRLRLVAGQPAALEGGGTAGAHGGRNGRRHRRHLSRAVGRRPVCRRGALQLAGVRGRGDHARRDCLRPLLLHVRHLRGLATAVCDPGRPHVQQPLGVGTVLAAGSADGRLGRALHADVLRLRAHLPPLAAAARTSGRPWARC